jgi:tyrosyl-tRNA synthetase
LGNYVGITEKPDDIFGKLMSVSDELMWSYFKLLTDIDVTSAKKMHPKEAKALLARNVVEFYYGKKAAQQAQGEFDKIFSKRQIPSQIKEYLVEDDQIDIVDTLNVTGLVASKNEARRLLNQGGISCDGNIVKTPKLKIIPQGVIIKVGKRRFIKIIPKKKD